MYPIDKNLLQNFDIYPKVFAAHVESEIHIRPLGGRDCFRPGQSYKLEVWGLDGSNGEDWPVAADYAEHTLTANEAGGFTFRHTFTAEQEYYLRFFDESGDFVYQFPVYCVDGDLIGRYPFQGDTHLHTTRSDGIQRPEVVTAVYRSYGYDFLALTDHRRYYPSLDNIAFYKDVPTEICLCPGEEVQHPRKSRNRNDIHLINFGGEYSVNALVEGFATEERGTDPDQRSLYGKCPESMRIDQFDDMMEDLCSRTEIPAGLDKYPAVSTIWALSQIRKANGVAILAHPNWINNMFHVPERFTDFLVEQKAFDALEVLGGELYYEQNGFQTLRYYEDRAKGYRYGIVGGSDSHSCYPSNPGYRVTETIVFSPENERTALISSIKDLYSVAVDQISREPRFVGSARFCRYACFLYQYYFPLHNELCAEEGRMMKQYAVGTQEEKQEALTVLHAIYGRVGRQRAKYFAF